ncbi:histidinol dehydrogenase [Sphingomonas ginkgonis]|uniref:Histidinol dehydrogenase n=1 Tax=Sphingomonas ginkgonis TaxID=2315330 RepID=A0A3S0EK37_9SPHN|nr:histidinol dehydrogenase [Sphingomonas ginkgonis]RST29498.1 histidinol dehydrogenase [Sphingomonas ginkgonis]
MKTLVWEELGPAEREAALARPAQRSDPALQDGVRSIVDQVRDGGWDALAAIAERIDGEAPRPVTVSPIAAEARRTLAAEQVAAIELAAANVRAFHAASRPADIAVETMPGLTVRKLWRAIDRVGLYVPGGRTPLFSTLLMLAIPAQAAGVRELVVITPPRAQGGLDPVVALAAELSGVDTVWTVGGAQGIAALAFGAGPIPRCDKICGPGNAWVAEAKRLVASMAHGPAIDMPAGPSELMVIADDRANPRTVAADLLSQAEHDSAAQVLLATPSQPLLEAIRGQVEQQVATLPRADLARRSLKAARFVLTANLAAAAEVANTYAPEHLSLAVSDPDALLPAIRNAGAVFAGCTASETFGDYLAGSSHVLPTDGAARAWGGISVYSFMKAMSVQTVTPAAAARIAGPAATLARMEGLEAHARSADCRLEPAA